MKKQEFREELIRGLSSLSKDECNKILDYYEENIADRIEEGMNEEEAIAALDNIDEIISNTINEQSFVSIINQKVNSSKENSSNKTIWFIIAIVGSPIWLPLLFASIILLFSAYLVIWSLVFALGALLVSLALTSIIAFLTGLFNISVSIPVTLALVGGSLFTMSACILCIEPFIKLVKYFGVISINFTKKIKKKLTNFGHSL
ncbi:MAG: DUF1700 domain-containing protein [Erysipelotrichaceae bacterium]